MSYDKLPDVPTSGEETLTSHPGFGSATAGTEVAQAFSGSIQGRNVLITGVSPRSLGGTLAVTVARHSPANLILASRTLYKLASVAKEIESASPNVTPHLVELDLGSFKSIRRSADQVHRLVDRLDIIINNAGLVSSDRRETADGLERTFGTNHVGHFLLTSLLTPLLLAATREHKREGLTRVVNVTSLGYRLSPIRFHDYNFQGKKIPAEEEPPAELPSRLKPNVEKGRPYQAFCAYGQSKTANILHCVSLNEKYGTRGIRAFAVHPGSIWETDMSRSLSPEDLKIIEGTSTSWITHDQGIATILVAALDPELAHGTSKVMMSECQFVDVADSAKDPETAERLWVLSEDLTRGRGKL